MRRFDIMSHMFKYLPLSLEIGGSVLALATENYWFFLIAAAGALYDLALHMKAGNK